MPRWSALSSGRWVLQGSMADQQGSMMEDTQSAIALASTSKDMHDVATAQQAMAVLQGATMEDSQSTIALDSTSKDMTKLSITGVPAGAGWQELKDHFAQAGMVVAYAGFKANPTDAVVGEVRYENPADAMKALQMLHRSVLGGSLINVQAAPGSKDGSKLLITGLTGVTQCVCRYTMVWC